MVLNNTAIGVAYILLGIPMAVVAYGAWQNREKSTAVYLMLSMAACVGWVLVYGLSIAVSNAAFSEAMTVMRNVFTATAAFFWVYLSVEYADLEWPKHPALVAVLAALPVVNLLVGATNPWHHLMFTPESTMQNGIFIPEFGPYFYVHAGMAYLMLTGTLAIYLLEFKNSRGVYRRQVAALILGMVLIWVGSLLFVTGALPIGNFDLTPIAIALSGAIMLTALFRYDLLELPPVARKTIIENMDDGVLALDNDGRIIDMNPRMEELVDVESDPVGESIDVLLAEYPDLLESIRAGETAVTVAVDGEQRFFDVNISPVYDSGDRMNLLDEEATQIGRTVVVRDITDQKRKERELERSRELLARTQELGDVGGWEYDVEADTVRWTDGMYQVCGVPKSFEPTPETTLELYRTEDSAAVRECIQTAITLGESFEHEGQLTTPSGETKWVTMHGKPSERAADGRVQTIRGALRDVTATRRRERELERQNEQLDRFASIVSHDLRNPLGIAQTYIDFAEETGEEDDFEAVRESLVRMDDMIEDILNFARTGGTVEETEPVSLPALAREAWENVETGASSLEVPDTGATVEADPNRLLHVFENCYRNAVEHNDDPVAIRVGIDTDDAERVTGFAIEDDGTGIPPERRDEVLDHGVTTREEGTGFGLSIVSAIVAAHSWQVSVEESKEGGARIAFSVQGGEFGASMATA